MQVITTTTIAGKIEELFIRLVFKEEIHHVKWHFGPIKFYSDDKKCWLHVYTCNCKQVDYSHVHVHADRKHFWWFLWRNNLTIKNNTTKLITPFHSESTVHCDDINISYCEKNIQNYWQKFLYYRLGVSSKFFLFWQFTQNTKQFTSEDSPSWAEQNSTNDFVIAIIGWWDILSSFMPKKAEICEQITRINKFLQYNYW